MGAARERPRVMEGSIMVLRFSMGSTENFTKPEAGSHCSFTDTSMMSSMPSQNAGMATPTIEMVLST